MENEVNQSEEEGSTGHNDTALNRKMQAKGQKKCGNYHVIPALLLEV